LNSDVFSGQRIAELVAVDWNAGPNFVLTPPMRAMLTPYSAAAENIPHLAVLKNPPSIPAASGCPGMSETWYDWGIDRR
jgi:hypothetical protein